MNLSSIEFYFGVITLMVLCFVAIAVSLLIGQSGETALAAILEVDIPLRYAASVMLISIETSKSLLADRHEIRG